MKKNEELNKEQLALVEYVTQPSTSDVQVPPLVVFGPFGTGKTQAMAVAAATILLHPDDFPGLRILICTHCHT